MSVGHVLCITNISDLPVISYERNKNHETDKKRFSELEVTEKKDFREFCYVKVSRGVGVCRCFLMVTHLV